MVKISIYSSGSGTCSLTGREETDGLNIAFESEQPCFLSKKAFWQLLSMRMVQARQGEMKTAPRTAPPAAPVSTPIAK